MADLGTERSLALKAGSSAAGAGASLCAARHPADVAGVAAVRRRRALPGNQAATVDWINHKLGDDAQLQQMHLVPVTEQSLAAACKNGVLLWYVAGKGPRDAF